MTDNLHLRDWTGPEDVGVYACVRGLLTCTYLFSHWLVYSVVWCVLEGAGVRVGA